MPAYLTDLGLVDRLVVARVGHGDAGDGFARAVAAEVAEAAAAAVRVAAAP